MVRYRRHGVDEFNVKDKGTVPKEGISAYGSSGQIWTKVV
jgi:hypothetical protein